MFTDEELLEILRILSIVLHLGNIQYHGNDQFNSLVNGKKRSRLFQ